MLSEANQLKEEIIANQRRLVFLTVSASLLIVLLLVSVWISRRKLQKKNRDLETMNHQITEKQLQITKQNQTLDKQNDELTSLNQTKDKFFSIVSHDLRGPFNSLLRSVLINFINNAIKFTPRGGKIVVKASPEDSRIKVCVTDNGIGIPENKLENIFELTNDYRQPGTEQEKGTGLGLITAKEFIILMGGKLEVKSKEGKGSSFCFTLPDASAAH